jgi:hypothetical protein
MSGLADVVAEALEPLTDRVDVDLLRLGCACGRDTGERCRRVDHRIDRLRNRRRCAAYGAATTGEGRPFRRWWSGRVDILERRKRSSEFPAARLDSSEFWNLCCCAAISAASPSRLVVTGPRWTIGDGNVARTAAAAPTTTTTTSLRFSLDCFFLGFFDRPLTVLLADHPDGSWQVSSVAILESGA